MNIPLCAPAVGPHVGETAARAAAGTLRWGSAAGFAASASGSEAPAVAAGHTPKGLPRHHRADQSQRRPMTAGPVEIAETPAVAAGEGPRAGPWGWQLEGDAGAAPSWCPLMK